MNILLTGAFGNVGVSTLKALAGRGHKLRCFDVATPANQKTAAQFGNSIEILWGDLTKRGDVAKAIAGMDVVLHIAAIIPPLSEKMPEKAKAVNVDGTRYIIEEMERSVVNGRHPRLVFCSSISVVGRERDHSKPMTPSDPLSPSDNYSHSKVTCENMIRASTLDWTILRLAAVMPLRVDQFDPIMFEISLDSQVEFVHTLDVGLALANAAESDQVARKVLLIGGGTRCQYLYREFFTKALDTTGVGMLPESAFGKNPWYTDWMDTSESQTLLRYQRYTYDDYLKEIGAILSWRRPLIRLLRPVIRQVLLKKSPYYGRG